MTNHRRRRQTRTRRTIRLSSLGLYWVDSIPPWEHNAADQRRRARRRAYRDRRRAMLAAARAFNRMGTALAEQLPQAARTAAVLARTAAVLAHLPRPVPPYLQDVADWAEENGIDP